MPTSSKEREIDEFIVRGSVTRYGPRTSCQRKGLNDRLGRGQLGHRVASFKALPPLDVRGTKRNREDGGISNFRQARRPIRETEL